MSKGSIPAGTRSGKDVTCHRGRGWLQLGWKPPRNSRGERNGRNLLGTATRGSPGKRRCVLFTKPSPGRGPAALDVRAALFAAWKGWAAFGGTARRRNKALRSQKPTFTRGRTLGLCPTDPALIAAASGGARPSGAGGGREGGDGAGRERKGRAGRREAGRRLALAAVSGGGSR